MSYQVAELVLTYAFEVVLGSGSLLLLVSFMMFCCTKMAEREMPSSVVLPSFADVFALEPSVNQELPSMWINGGTDAAAHTELEWSIPILDNRLVINLEGIAIYKLHKKDAVYVADLPCELPSEVQVRQLRKRDAVYLRDLKAVATLIGV